MITENYIEHIKNNIIYIYGVKIITYYKSILNLER